MPIFMAARSTSPSVTEQGDRVTDGPILAHHIFILKTRDAGTGTVIFGHIGTADEVNDLIGLDAHWCADTSNTARCP